MHLQTESFGYCSGSGYLSFNRLLILSYEWCGVNQKARNPALSSRIAGFIRSIPVVLFTAVQRGDPVHLLRSQRKTEQIEILADVIRIG